VFDPQANGPSAGGGSESWAASLGAASVAPSAASPVDSARAPPSKSGAVPAEQADARTTAIASSSSEGFESMVSLI
jgi:hypothetical protein